MKPIYKTHGVCADTIYKISRYLSTCVVEVLCVVVDVESGEVGAQHATQNLLSVRQRRVHLGRHKWGV